MNACMQYHAMQPALVYRISMLTSAVQTHARLLAILSSLGFISVVAVYICDLFLKVSHCDENY